MMVPGGIPNTDDADLEMALSERSIAIWTISPTSTPLA